jgi:hypothetical protein
VPLSLALSRHFRQWKHRLLKWYFELFLLPKFRREFPPFSSLSNVALTLPTLTHFLACHSLQKFFALPIYDDSQRRRKAPTRPLPPCNFATAFLHCKYSHFGAPICHLSLARQKLQIIETVLFANTSISMLRIATERGAGVLIFARALR